MDEGKSVIFDAPFSRDHLNIINDVNVMKLDDRLSSSSSSSSSIGGDSSTSPSYDTTDDASSACNSSNTSSYDLSELMAQLPIKRGLSKFYQGKSQSFTYLSRVESVENLAKKQTPYNRRKMKACKSYGGGLDTYKSHTSLIPKPIISRKNYTRGSFFITPKSNFATPMVPCHEKQIRF